jgi:serine/threonine-protein kinase
MATEHLSLARERLGQVLRDRWLLEKVIGVGGMAAVYQARHRNGARVAIKLLHAAVGDDPVVRERFLREAYLANIIGHANVARVLDDDADPLLGPFIVMELLQGSSLLDRLDHGEAFDPMRAMNVADQSLDVLALAHTKGIVHRDLKPANLFLTDLPDEELQVRVLDFGIARIIEDNQARLTRTGVPLGTPAYMAPEQARGMGRHVDGRADIYALGATLFKTLTGRHVHIGQGADQIVKVATERAPSLALIAPQVPRDVCAIVDRALQFEPDRRYGSAEEMQSDVRAVRTGRRPRAPRLPTPMLPSPRTAPRPDIEALAESMRAEAHKQARRPDAFSVAAPPPQGPAYEDDDNLPTAVLPPKAGADLVAEARAIAAKRGMAVPPSLGGAAPNSSGPLRSSSSAKFPAIKNVPVPSSFTPGAGIPVARMPTPSPMANEDERENLPTVTQGGAIVLPPAVPTHFEETQYQMEQARRAQAPSSSSPSSGGQAAAPPSRPFASTIADPSALTSARYALDSLGSQPSGDPMRSSSGQHPALARAPTPPPASGSQPWPTSPVSQRVSQPSRPSAPISPAAATPAPPPMQDAPRAGMSPVMIAFAVVLVLIIATIVIAILRTM